MVYKVYSGRVGGILGDLITVEVDSSPGLPGLEMIGLLSSEVKEAKDRVRVALKNNGISLPSMRITVNLSPADEHKAGSAFDLPIAVAILGVYGYIPDFLSEETLIIGELSLDGKILPADGILPIVKMAKENGFKRVILPADNAGEGALIRGIDIIPVGSLGEVMAYLATPAAMRETIIPPYRLSDDAMSSDLGEAPDFFEVLGQESVKRAAQIAAAGFHNFLMIGPPGTGKSLIAKRIPGIMPKLSYEDSLEITTIYSVAGKLSNEYPFVTKRPFLGPHHGTSIQAIIGGGTVPRPGLASLCHGGILFFDEMPEFKKEVLDALRQPMEDKTVTISRAKNTVSFPAGFMFVGAMNPCPCGYYPDRNRCSCTGAQISRYLSKLSGPIIDRIDICTEVPRLEPSDMAQGKATPLSSRELSLGVARAVDIQRDRFKGQAYSFNSQIPGNMISYYIPLGKSENDFAYSLYENMRLSTRSFYKMLKVARTIADMEGSEYVEIKHIAEASCYRIPEYIRR